MSLAGSKTHTKDKIHLYLKKSYQIQMVDHQNGHSSIRKIDTIFITLDSCLRIRPSIFYPTCIGMKELEDKGFMHVYLFISNSILRTRNKEISYFYGYKESHYFYLYTNKLSKQHLYWFNT